MGDLCIVFFFFWGGGGGGGLFCNSMSIEVGKWACLFKFHLVGKMF
jgi:hypothetical protein